MARHGSSFTTPTREDKERALYDYWAFIDLINFHGGSKAYGDCHRELVNWFDTHFEVYNKLILIPRGHLKSTLLTVGKVLWRIYQIPDIRIFVGTATRALATAFVREIRTYLESPILMEYVWNNRPHIYGRLIPEMERTKYRRDDSTESRDKKIIWSSTAIQVIRPTIMKEPTVTVGSVGTIPTGFHFDEMYLDDVVNYDNINTPDKRNRLIGWIDDLRCVLDPAYFDDGWRTILPAEAERYCNVGGKFTVVGTRYDREDWYGSIIEDADEKGWKTYQRNIYNNGHNNSDGYLWHETWNEQIEHAKRMSMSTSRFASQYLNTVIAPGSSILDLEKIHWISAYQITRDNEFIQIEHSTLDNPSKFRPILVVDPAATIGEDSDFTAMVVGGKDVQGRVFVVDGVLGKWTSEKILENLYRLADKWSLRAVHIESVGGFAHFVQYVRSAFNRYRPIVLNEYKPTWVQGKKEVRISNALEPLITNGLLYLPGYIKTNTEITDQITFFPRRTIHDDFPDCLAALAELSKSPQPKAVNRLKTQLNTRYGGFR